MKYYYNPTSGQILVKMPSLGTSKRKDPYIDTDQNINDNELDNWQVNTSTLVLESKN